MTQAYNLSQLANNLNSSGQLDATDGLVNAVPVANGGTGASDQTTAQSNLNVPSRTGANASGTWSISISGNAATATTATSATSATNATTAAACTGNSATATKLTTASGSAPSYSARAWVCFNGTGSIGANQSILASGNVSSVYKNDTGDYTVNFSVAMPDANYSCSCTSSDTSGAVGATSLFVVDSPAKNSSAVRVRSTFSTANVNGARDSSECSVVVFD